MKQEIKLLASDLDVNEQSQLQTCPFCNGGMSNDLSFTIRRTPEGLLYLCYRASCGAKGFIPSVGISFDYFGTPKDQNKKKPNPFKKDISALEKHHVTHLLEQFPALTEDIISREGVAFSYEAGRILYPCFDIRGYTFAWNARWYPWTGEFFHSKSILYWNTHDVPKIHFPRSTALTDTITLVEDQVSAMVLAQYTPTASILGTSLPEPVVHHLISCGIRRLQFALDNDATDKAVYLAKKYALEFDTDVLCLPKDIKNMTDIEIGGVIGT